MLKVFLFILFFNFNTHWRIFFPLLSRESGSEERERKRDTSVGCLLHVPLPALGDLHPRSVPLTGIRTETLWSSGWRSNHWATLARVLKVFLDTKFVSHSMWLPEAYVFPSSCVCEMHPRGWGYSCTSFAYIAIIRQSCVTISQLPIILFMGGGRKKFCLRHGDTEMSVRAQCRHWADGWSCRPIVQEVSLGWKWRHADLI